MSERLEEAWADLGVKKLRKRRLPPVDARALRELLIMLGSLRKEAGSFFKHGRMTAKKKLANGYTVTFDIRERASARRPPRGK